MWWIILILVFAIVIFLIWLFSGETDSSELSKTEAYVERCRSIEELTTMRINLEKICKSLYFKERMYQAGKLSKDGIKALKAKKAEYIPGDKRIYGCNTYYSAVKLLQQVNERIYFLETLAEIRKNENL